VLYVYAITDAPDLPLPPRRGHGQAHLRVVADGGLAAVCTRHDDLRLSADEPSLWRHERVTEALAADRGVLPVRFGTTVADEQELRRLLGARRAECVAALELVRDRVELGVRVLWDPRAAESHAPADESGSAYLRAKLEAQRSAQTRAAELHAALSEQAVASRRRVLPTPRLLLSGAYLVDRDGVDGFLAAADRLAVAGTDLQLVCTGPWPAHNFATPAEEAHA
jgi:hypothetical protein